MNIVTIRTLDLVEDGDLRDRDCAQSCAQTTPRTGNPGPTLTIQVRGIRPENVRPCWVQLWPLGLANRRLQPLGHLTGSKTLGNLRISVELLSCEPPTVPKTVPRPFKTLSIAGTPEVDIIAA